MADFASGPRMIVMTDGYSWMFPVWRKLQELQDRGIRFISVDAEHFDCEPASKLTDEDIQFLKSFRMEAVRILSYRGPTCH